MKLIVLFSKGAFLKYCLKFSLFICNY